MLTFSIICRGQNGEDEVESTSLGPGDMPTGDIPTHIQWYFSPTHIQWYFCSILFSDRILEAEKICDKQEMEQFPNEGDDIQVAHLIQMIYRWHILYKGLWSTCNVGSHKTDACGIKQVFSLQGHIWFQRYFSHQAKFKFAAERQLASLVEWAKHIPHFTELPLEDQVNTLTPLIIFLS